MLNDKTKLFSLISIMLILLTIGFVSAADDGDTLSDKIESDNSPIIEDDINEIKNDNNKNIKNDEAVEITEQTYNDNFNEGIYIGQSEKLIISGQLSDKQLNFYSPVTITSKDDNSKLYNSTISFNTGSSGSTLSNLYINNENNDEYVIQLDTVTDITISNNIIIQKNDEGRTYAIKLNKTNESYILNNNITVNGMEYDITYNSWGTLGVGNLSAIQGFKSSNNLISDNIIDINADNKSPNGMATTTTTGIEFMADAYSYDRDDSTDNTISNNTINIDGINYAYAIKLSNKIERFIINNNTINSTSKNAYGIEYAYGSNGKVTNNNVLLNASDLSFGIIITTNSMGASTGNIVENNSIISNDANITYLIEVYGARSTTINNNNLTGNASYIEAIATSTIDNSIITNNNITITGDTSKEVMANVESISVELTGINIRRASSNLNITNNYINVTDIADGEIYTIVYNGTGSIITDNTLYSSNKEGHKSVYLFSMDNIIGNNYPINPDAIIITMNPIAVEVGDSEDIIVQVTDLDGNPLSYGNVSFIIDDEQIGTSTLTDGIAKISYTCEQVSTIIVTAKYEPNTVYLENSTDAEISVIEPSIYAGIIYVSPDGNDANYGTVDLPKKTIKAAVKAATKENASKQIKVNAGTYEATDIKITTELNITGQENVIITARNQGKIFEIIEATVVISDITLADGNSPSGALINTTGELTLNNVILENSLETKDGGVIKSNNKLTVINSTFRNNMVYNYGGAIYRLSTEEELTIENSSFINNTCSQYSSNGGAIYVSGRGLVTINGSLFENNYARQATIYSSSNITITNTKFNHNGQENGSYNAADLYISSANINLENVTSTQAISRNQATFLYFSGANNNIMANNIIIEENNGTNGIIYINNVNNTQITKLNMTKNNIKTNAIIYINNGKNITIEDSVFEDNNSTNRFLYMYGLTTNFTIQNSQIINNNARNFMENRGNITITNTLIENNTAENNMFFKKYSTTAKYYLEDNEYNSNNLPTKITVSDIASECLVNREITFKVAVSEVEIDVSVTSGNIEVYESDILIDTFEVTEAETTIKYTPKKATNEVNIVYKSDNNDYATNNTLITINTVKTAPSSIIIDVPESVNVGDKINLTAKITSQYGDVSGGKVVFKVNGKTLKDAEGKIIYAKVTGGTATVEDYEITESLLKNGMIIQAVYSGSSTYDSSRSENTIVEVTQNDNVTLELDPQSADKGSTVTITVKVTLNNQNITSGKIVLKINGKTVKDDDGKVIYAKISDGIVTFNYTIPNTMKSRTYELTATFTDTKYPKTETKSTLTVQ